MLLFCGGGRVVKGDRLRAYWVSPFAGSSPVSRTQTFLFFSKTNKNFFGVIDTIKENLYQLPKFKSLKEIKKNELELILNSDNQGQIIKIRIFVFNLYSKKMSEV